MLVVLSVSQEAWDTHCKAPCSQHRIQANAAARPHCCLWEVVSSPSYWFTMERQLSANLWWKTTRKRQINRNWIQWLCVFIRCSEKLGKSFFFYIVLFVIHFLLIFKHNFIGMGLQDDRPQKKWICMIKCPCINNHKIDWQPKNKFLHLLPSASIDFIVVSSNNKL